MARRSARLAELTGDAGEGSSRGARVDSRQGVERGWKAVGWTPDQLIFDPTRHASHRALNGVVSVNCIAEL